MSEFKKGRRFIGPGGQAYELLQDAEDNAPIMADQFKAIGGAPEPRDGEDMPLWLSLQLGVTMQFRG
jgi:hypothetical protein